MFRKIIFLPPLDFDDFYSCLAWVAGSSPDEVDFLNRPNLSGRIMDLGSTESLTEMSTRNL
jgi:hypothetical protein